MPPCLEYAFVTFSLALHHLLVTPVKKLPSNCPTIKIFFKLSDNQDLLQVPSRSSWRVVAASSHTHEYTFLTLYFAFHHISVNPVEKFPLICQTIKISFKFFQEAVDELLQHASTPISMHISPFVFHFITYWPFLWKNYLQIVRQLGFPSRTFRKQLTSCCSMLSGPQICIPNFCICILLLIDHSYLEITFKLSDNQDFLQEPSGSSWQAVAACFHAHRFAFLSLKKLLSLTGHFCGEITFKLSGKAGFPSSALQGAVDELFRENQKRFCIHFPFLRLCYHPK